MIRPPSEVEPLCVHDHSQLYTPTKGGEANAHVDHENLILGELRHLGLLLVVGPDSEQATEQKVVDLDLGVDRRERALGAEDLADQSVTTGQLRVDHCAGADASAPYTPSNRRLKAGMGERTGTDTDQAAGDGKLELVLLGEERDNLAPDRLAVDLTLGILRDDTRADFNLLAELMVRARRGGAGGVSITKRNETNRTFLKTKTICRPGARTHLENTLEERTTGDTTLEFVHLGTGLVDVKGPNHNQLGRGRKVAHGDRDLGHDVLDEGINIVPQLGRDRNDRSPIRHGSLDELEDLLVVFVGLLFADQVDLVLEDEDVLEFHDLDRGEVLGRLRLRARFVRGDEEQRGVHHGGTVQHGRHQNVVTGTVDKRDVSEGGSHEVRIFSNFATERGGRKRTHRRSFILPPHPGTSQGGSTSLSELYDR